MRIVLPAVDGISTLARAYRSLCLASMRPLKAAGAYWLVDEYCDGQRRALWLAPFGAYTLLEGAMTDIAHQVVEFEEFFGATGRQISERVYKTDSLDRSIVLIDRFIHDITDGSAPSPDVCFALRCIRATNGQVRIADLIKQIGCSHRHFTDVFRRQLGLTPKRAAKTLRFDHLLRDVHAKPWAGWQQLAAENGYADQAHLTRDFREYTGVTPVEFVRTHRNCRSSNPPSVDFVQDAAGVYV